MWKTYVLIQTGLEFMRSRSGDNIISVIDLGTNTCLLLIASLENNFPVKIFEAQEIPRLGKDLYKTKKIPEEKFTLVSGIFRKYIVSSREYGSRKILAFGTSALRDAENSKEFIDFIRKDTGVGIRVISGEEEAYYGYLGAVTDMEESENYAVLDIGGGSTEISYRSDGEFNHKSINIGSVRLYENYFRESNSELTIKEASDLIKKELRNFSSEDLKCRSLIGVAGTLTTLSAIKHNLNKFDEKIIHKDILHLSEIKNIFSMLKFMKDREILNIGEYMKGRSEIILSGTLILISVMEYSGIDSVTVSVKGLRYGLANKFADFL